MIRSGLVRALAEQNPTLSPCDVERLVNVFEALSEKLCAAGRIELRGFGAFTIRDRSGFAARNPSTSDAIAVPAKRSGHFKPSISMRDRLN